jgi:hypothetical protein
LPGATGGSLVQNIQPLAVSQLGNTVANYASGLPQQVMDTYQNWYNGDLSAGPAPGTQQAATMAQQTNPWAPQVQGAISGLQQQVPQYLQAAQQAFTQNQQYDPAELQKYLNPYTQDAAQATLSGINRNLTENLLPGINSTFAGTGQFGSSRNANFTNNALRDTQQAGANALAAANYGAYNDANKFYADWANRGVQVGQGLSQLGQVGINAQTAAGNLANQGSGIDQRQFDNLMSSGARFEGLQQNAFDKTYNDWLTQQKYPAAMMGGLGSLAASMNSALPPDRLTTESGGSTSMSQNERLAAALQLLNQGVNDEQIQKLVGGLAGGVGSVLGWNS